ncbi:TIGR00730 family protein [Mycobacterium tuberculosis]|nr:TIGR00730 family protein [Mycobacterium tuberculosis]
MSAKIDITGDWTVAVYCAASPTHAELLELAAEVGAAIAGRGWTLVGEVAMFRRWGLSPRRREPAAAGPSA